MVIIMNDDKEKINVYCPECGALLEKSSLSKSEIKCFRCKNIIAIEVNHGKVTTWRKNK